MYYVNFIIRINEVVFFLIIERFIMKLILNFLFSFTEINF